MKKEAMEKWCAALESGKFGQTRTKLRQENTMNFCCLGVACHVYAPAAWDKEDSTVRSYDLSLPNSIKDHMGLRSDTGELYNVPLKILRKHGIGAEGFSAPDLAELNDKYCWTFKQIAALIRDAYKYI